MTSVDDQAEWTSVFRNNDPRITATEFGGDVVETLVTRSQAWILKSFSEIQMKCRWSASSNDIALTPDFDDRNSAFAANNFRVEALFVVRFLFLARHLVPGRPAKLRRSPVSAGVGHFMNGRSNAEIGAKPACVKQANEQSSRRLMAASVVLLSTGEGTDGPLVTTRLFRSPPFLRRFAAFVVVLSG